MITYPKEKLHNLCANLIGSKLFDGVYWFHVSNSDFELNQKLNALRQSIVKSREPEANILTILQTKNLKTAVLNKELAKVVLKSIITDTYKNNSKLPRIENLDLDYYRNNELDLFVKYIKSLPLNKSEIDVYLYKTGGERQKSIYFTDGQKHFKKNIIGFYLTKQDIEEANEKLAESNRRISNITAKESLDTSIGIRFTLELDEAVFIG